MTGGSQHSDVAQGGLRQWRIASLVKQFKAAKDSLGDLDAEAAATLVAAAADVALILDRKGVIRDLAFDS